MFRGRMNALFLSNRLYHSKTHTESVLLSFSVNFFHIYCITFLKCFSRVSGPTTESALLKVYNDVLLSVYSGDCTILLLNLHFSAGISCRELHWFSSVLFCYTGPITTTVPSGRFTSYLKN